MSEALRKQFHDTYKIILGRNKYNQNLRSYVFNKHTDGSYYSDCSSSICAAMNRIGVKMGLLNTAGMYNSNLWKEVPVAVVNGHVKASDIPKLRIGDALMFRGTDPARPLQIGHVEAVYEINGSTENGIVICGHGSGAPSTKNMKAYCTMRESSKASNGKTKGLVCVLRAIADDTKLTKPTKTSQNGIDLIKQFEGCRLTAYEDSAGVWTIGYGHTSGVKQGQKITQVQAEEFLKNDLATFEDAVNKYVTVVINQNQFDALVSFTFNCGGTALKNSTLLKKLNAGDYAGAADEFPKWNKAGGKVLQGLVNRRAKEKELFLSGASTQAVQAAQVSSTYSRTDFVKDVQKSTGSKVDGIPGNETIGNTVTVSRTKNKNHIVVTPLERYLKALGYYTGAIEADQGKTPCFGAGMETAVNTYQKAILGFKNPDGEITKGKGMWKSLLGMD